MSKNPARLLVAAGVTLGTIFFLSSRRRRSAKDIVQSQAGYPPNWPKGVTLGMGTPVKTKLWARKQAPWEIAELVAPLEDAGLWAGQLAPFLSVIAYRESKGDPNAPLGWFGLPPELVFTGDLAPLRAYPELLRYPKFAVIAAVRRIDELQRKYEGMGLTWYDVQRAWTNDNLIQDRPALGYAQYVFAYPESEAAHAGFNEGMDAVLQANDWYKDMSNRYGPFLLSESLETEFSGQVPDVYMISDQALFDATGIDFKL